LDSRDKLLEERSDELDKLRIQLDQRKEELITREVTLDKREKEFFGSV